MVKTIVLLINFVKTMIHFTGFFDEEKVQKNIFYLIFCDIINISTVTFNQFNAFLLNKYINVFLKKKPYSPQRFECLCIRKQRSLSLVLSETETSDVRQ